MTTKTTKKTEKKPTREAGRGTTAALAVIGIGVAAYYWMKGGAVKAEPSPMPGLPLAPPSATPEEKKGADQAEKARQALLDAQYALERAKAIKAAEDAARREADLAAKEAEAIRKAGDLEAARRAEAAEAEAQARRRELQAQWSSALTDAERAMNQAKAAADRAVAAYVVSKKAVEAAQRRVDTASLGVQNSNRVLQSLTEPWVYAEMTIAQRVAFGLALYVPELVPGPQRAGVMKQLESYRLQWVAAGRALETAKAAAGRVKLEALTAVGRADLTTERVLTITADVAILGYVSAVANRVDSVAKATRDALRVMTSTLQSLDDQVTYLADYY